MVHESLLNEEGKFKFVPQEVAAAVTSKHRFVTHKQSHVIWVYGNGSYISEGEELIRAEVRELLGDQAKEGRVNEVVAHIRETTFTDPERFKPPVKLVNFKNGVLNMETNELSPHSPDTIFTNELPVEWNPSAECPKIMKFLSEVLHPDDIPVIQEIVGYCLLRDYRFAKAVMLLGSGANGKSTLLNLIAALLGKRNVATPALQDLIYHRFAKAELYGKLANIHADIPTHRLKYTGIFKMLTGQDIIWAEKKHANPFEFENYAKLLYSANELPQTDDMSEAFWRRWIIIEFPNNFPDDDPQTDPDIIKKLTVPSELSGFLAWAFGGLVRLLENKKFTMTKTREEIETEWITRTDSLRAFVMKHVEADAGCYVVKDGFYTAYQEFCDNREVPPVEKGIVGRRLPTLFPKTFEFRPLVDNRQQRAWKGIRLTEPYEYMTRTEIQEELSFFHNSSQKNEKNLIKRIENVSDIRSTRAITPPKWLICEFQVSHSRFSCIDPDTEQPIELGPFDRGDTRGIPAQFAHALEKHGIVKIKGQQARSEGEG